jgi:3-oxoadipate enol-lactonase
MRMASLNGIRVHYADDGPADGPALLFSNSLGTDFRVWDRLLPLLPAGLRLIRYDKRGHGLSECPAAPYRMEELVADAGALLDHLEVVQATMVGLSIGGMIAQGLAAERPGLIRGLVLCDTAAKIGSDEIWDQRLALVNRGGIAAIEEQVLTRWFTRRFREERQDELAGWRHMLCRTPEDGYVGCCHAIRDTDLRESSPNLRQPALVVVGEEDGSTPPDLVREFAASIPGARFELIRGAGHLPPVEQPGLLAGLITSFLGEHGLA